MQTRAELDGDEWVINGQKVWTSLAHVVALVLRRRPHRARVARHKGLSFLLVPMDQPGIEIRPIVQITGGGEFNETFFDDARTEARSSSARSTRAGRSRWACSASSAASRRSPSRSASSAQLRTTVDLAADAMRRATIR